MFRRTTPCCLAVLLLVPTLGKAADPKLETDTDKTIYALGVSVAHNLSKFQLSGGEVDLLVAGLRDGLAGRDPKVDMTDSMNRIRAFLQTRVASANKVEAQKEKDASAAFLKEAAAREGALKTDSGLIYREIKAGTGASPTATSKIKANYTGKYRDGTVFDSSEKHGRPIEIPLNQVIPCWTEGFQKMKVGGKAELVCPSDIAYGDMGHPPIPPGATLVFDVELLDILQ